MSIKKQFAKRYIPPQTKWKLALKGIGKLYRAIYDELEEEDKNSSDSTLSKAAYRIGKDFGQTLKADFKLGNTIDDIGFAMEIDHNIFGMKAKIAEHSRSRIVYYCYQCAWKKYFEPRLCLAMGQAEKGVAQALNTNAKYNILQTRTMGRDKCIFTVEV